MTEPVFQDPQDDATDMTEAPEATDTDRDAEAGSED